MADGPIFVCSALFLYPGYIHSAEYAPGLCPIRHALIVRTIFRTQAWRVARGLSRLLSIDRFSGCRRSFPFPVGKVCRAPQTATARRSCGVGPRKSCRPAQWKSLMFVAGVLGSLPPGRVLGAAQVYSQPLLQSTRWPHRLCVCKWSDTQTKQDRALRLLSPITTLMGRPSKSVAVF